MLKHTWTMHYFSNFFFFLLLFMCRRKLDDLLHEGHQVGRKEKVWYMTVPLIVCRVLPQGWVAARGWGSFWIPADVNRQRAVLPCLGSV